MLAYFDCFSGVSGDMILGALVDAGLPLETLREQLGNVEVGGYRLEAREHSDHELHGTRLEVVLDSRDQPARRLAEILDLLESSRLDSTIVDRARRTFERLALAEAAIHGVTPEEVHLHGSRAEVARCPVRLRLGFAARRWLSRESAWAAAAARPGHARDPGTSWCSNASDGDGRGAGHTDGCGAHG
jgi:hypothetical protein